MNSELSKDQRHASRLESAGGPLKDLSIISYLHSTKLEGFPAVETNISTSDLLPEAELISEATGDSMPEGHVFGSPC